MTPILIKSLPTLHLVLSLALGALTISFLIRIILTWYPEINLQKGFWSLFALPTEPFLAITRKFVSPIGGVDVTPVIWVGLISLIRELLVGQQGILSLMLMKNGIIN